MRKSALYSSIVLSSLTMYSCNNGQNPEDINKQIQTNQTLLVRKKTELSDLNYKVTSNSLHVGTKDYDSTIGKNFNTRSAAIQASIDSLKAQTDSLEQLVTK